MSCCHAIACLRHERIQPESVLPGCYSVDTFKNAYQFSIWPCRDKSEWEHVNGPTVSPPVYEKKVGRPPKSRRSNHMRYKGKMDQNFPSMGSRYIAATVQKLTTTVEVANLKSRVSLLWRLKKWLPLHKHNNKGRLRRLLNSLLHWIQRLKKCTKL